MNSSHINLCKFQSASTYKLSPVRGIINIIFLLEYTLVNVFVTGQILIQVKIFPAQVDSPFLMFPKPNYS